MRNEKSTLIDTIIKENDIKKLVNYIKDNPTKLNMAKGFAFATNRAYFYEDREKYMDDNSPEYWNWVQSTNQWYQGAQEIIEQIEKVIVPNAVDDADDTLSLVNNFMTECGFVDVYGFRIHQDDLQYYLKTPLGYFFVCLDGHPYPYEKQVIMETPSIKVINIDIVVKHANRNGFLDCFFPNIENFNTYYTNENDNIHYHYFKEDEKILELYCNLPECYNVELGDLKYFDDCIQYIFQPDVSSFLLSLIIEIKK